MSTRVITENWTLTAAYEGGEESRRLQVYPPSYEAVRLCELMRESDSEASAGHLVMVWTAVCEVMNLASKHEIWAKGRIELRDEHGALVHEMEAKS